MYECMYECIEWEDKNIIGCIGLNVCMNICMNVLNGYHQMYWIACIGQQAHGNPLSSCLAALRLLFPSLSITALQLHFIQHPFPNQIQFVLENNCLAALRLLFPAPTTALHCEIR